MENFDKVQSVEWNYKKKFVAFQCNNFVMYNEFSAFMRFRFQSNYYYAKAESEVEFVCQFNKKSYGNNALVVKHDEIKKKMKIKFIETLSSHLHNMKHELVQTYSPRMKYKN